MQFDMVVTLESRIWMRKLVGNAKDAKEESSSCILEVASCQVYFIKRTYAREHADRSIRAQLY